MVCAWKPAAEWIMQMQGDVNDLNDIYSFGEHMAPGVVHAARQHGHLQFWQRLKKHYEGAMTELHECHLKLEAKLHKAWYQLRGACKLA